MAQVISWKSHTENSGWCLGGTYLIHLCHRSPKAQFLIFVIYINDITTKINSQLQMTV